jgi:hypothetical protein
MPETIPRNPTVQERGKVDHCGAEFASGHNVGLSEVIDLSLFSLTTNAVA